MSKQITDVAPQIETKNDWRTPYVLLLLMTAVMQIGFAAWMSMTNNFAFEVLSFTGREIGLQQSIREIPGFLAFTAVLLLFYIREQNLAFLAIIVLGVGVAATGYMPSAFGFYFTTFISSVGFHYYETMQQSLSLQWLPQKTAPSQMGKIISIAAFSQLTAYGMVALASKVFGFDFKFIFFIMGGLSLISAIGLWLIFPVFPEKVIQNKGLILRKRYWLYYALTFIGGARRQIFIVFASFMMVERFGFKIHEVALLFIVNGLFNMVLAPYIGKLITIFGERKALTLEYIGLAIIFTAYAFVDTLWVAIMLYIIDHAFFAMAIAMKTYFQKIADPADMAPTAGVAFTINHIAAVALPITFGILWLYSPALVFLTGTALALCSLGLSRIIPRAPNITTEFIWKEKAK